jgi:hypothetical protein
VTVGEWLLARTPVPPPPLAKRVHAALGDRLNERSTHAYDALLGTAESLLGELLALGCAQRDRALDLLAVDALVTYAFEAASESPDTLAERAIGAMSAIARQAVSSSGA